MWSWTLSGTGLLALWLLGNKSHWGFIVGLLSDVLWGVYSLQTHQWGFIIACGIYAGLHIRNLVKWKTDSRGEPTLMPMDPQRCQHCGMITIHTEDCPEYRAASDG